MRVVSNGIFTSILVLVSANLVFAKATTTTTTIRKPTTTTSTTTTTHRPTTTTTSTTTSTTTTTLPNVTYQVPETNDVQSPASDAVYIFGPEVFQPSPKHYKRIMRDIDLGDNSAGNYILSVQNGNYGPFSISDCDKYVSSNIKKQCQYNNILQNSDDSSNRISRAQIYLNSKSVFQFDDSDDGAIQEKIVHLNKDNSMVLDALGQSDAIMTVDLQVPPASGFKNVKAYYTVDNVTGKAPLDVDFDSKNSYSVNGDNLSYHWDFGDNNTSTKSSPSHTFKNAGTYNVSLIVKDSHGGADTFSFPIIVKAKNGPKNQLPLLNLLVQFPDPANLRQVSVDTTGSYDPDGAIAKTEINFGDGVKVKTPTALHSYVKDGAYIITVKLKDDDDGITTFKYPIVINSQVQLQIGDSVFGPQKYYGAKKGSVTNSTFDIPADQVSQSYLIEVKNADGSLTKNEKCEKSFWGRISCLCNRFERSVYNTLNRADSISVYVNGVLVNPKGSLNKGRGSFDKVISLQQHNTVTVKVKGLITSYAEVEIHKLIPVNANQPPIISSNLTSGETVADPAITFHIQSNSDVNVQVFRNGNLEVSSNDKDISLLLNEGTQSFEVRATDSNNMQAQPFILDSVTLDTQPPVVASSIQSGQYTNSNSFVVTVMDLSSVTTNVSKNGSLLMTSTQGQFSVPLTEGPQSFEIDSVDKWGHTAASYVISNVTLRTTPPVLAYVSPAQFIFNGFPTVVNLLASSDEVVQMTVNGQAMIDGGNGQYSSQVSIPQSGSTQFIFSATDLAGNTATLTQTFNVVLDNIAPVVSVDLTERSLTSQSVVPMDIQVADVSAVWTTISVNNVEVLQTGANDFSYNVALSQEGDNVIQISSTDAAGNISQPVSRIVKRDTIAPTLASFSPANGATIRAAAFGISGQASEPISSISVNGMALTLAGDQITFSGTYITQTMGNQSLHWVMVDLAGNQGTYDSAVNVDSTLLNPALVSVRPASDGIHLNVVGATGAARAGADVYASAGMFSLNTADGTVKPDGSFLLAMSAFSTATLKVTSGSDSASMNLAFNAGTILSGVVEDTNGLSLYGAKVSIQGTTLTTTSDANGNFSIASTSTGDQVLVIDGATIPQSVTGSNRTFSKVNIAVNIGLGQTNTLPRPVYLAPVRLDGTQTVVTNGSAAVAKSPDDSNIALTIPTSSMTFPNGSSSGNISIGVVDSNKTTIPVPAAAVPDKVVTLEPSGLKFNKRVQLTLSNDNELPAGVQLAIFSMNSTTGRWEVDGLAQVDSSGQTITTLPGNGISHFSLVYAVPVSPVVTTMTDPSLAGINASNGSLDTSISLPSFKSIGSDVKLGLRYKSAWARPTALVSNIFDIPQQNVTLTKQFTYDNSGYQYVANNYAYIGSDGKTAYASDYTEYYLITHQQVNSTYTSWYQPDDIKSQFFVSSIASEQAQFQFPSSSSSATLPGPNYQSGIQSNIGDYLNGKTTQFQMSYGIELTDPTTSNYLPTGIYPSLARYQITLKHMVMTSSTSVSTVSDTSGNAQTVVTPSSSTDTTVINDIAPQDVLQNLIVQNKVNSAYGRGWHLVGAQKILNPTGGNIVVEEANGDLSTYSLNQQINTIYDGNPSGSIDLTSAVDLSHWPQFVGVSMDSVNNSYLAQGSFLGSGLVSLGQLFTQSGTLGSDGYTCVNNKSGQFTTVNYPYNYVVKAGGYAVAADGSIFVTDSRGQAIESLLGGNSSLWAGAFQDPTYGFPGYNSAAAPSSDFCISTFGVNCGAAQPLQTYNCSAVNPISHCPIGSICLYPTLNPSQGTYPMPGYFGDGNGSFGPRPLVNNPSAMLALSSGSILFADTGNNRVRILNTSSGVNTFAGNGTNLDNGDGGVATNAGIFHPNGLAQDDQGNIYISSGTGYIRKVDGNGNISTIAGLPLGSGGVLSDQAAMAAVAFNNPTSMAFDSKNRYLYVSDTGNNRVVRLDLNSGIATKIAGDGTCTVGSGNGDTGPALQASICSPTSLGLDDNQNLVIVDSGHKRIRRINFGTVSQGSLTFLASNRDMSTLLRKSDGTWSRQYRNGDVANYDSNGYQVSFKARSGSGLVYQYDGNYNLVAMTDSAGQAITYEYSGNQLSSIQDPAGRKTLFSYNGSNLTSVVFPDGSRKNYVYNDKGLLSEEDDQLGRATKYSYNDWNRINTVTRADGAISTVSSYDAAAASQASPQSLQGGVGDGNAYNSFTDANQVQTRFDSDLNGYVSTVRDGLGQITTIQRDIWGNPTLVTNPDGSQTAYSYDQNTSDVVSVADVSAGISSSYKYDAYGNLIKKVDGNGGVSQSVYDPATGLLVSSTNAAGVTTTFTYNSLGLPLQQTVYPQAGTAQSMTYQYDSRGNVVQIAYANGNTINSTYDLAGNPLVVTSTSASGSASRTFTYDSMNRITSVKEANGDTTNYQYFPTGNISQIKFPNGRSSAFTYDLSGKLISRTLPSGQMYQFAYDNAGNTIQEIDPSGNVKKYTYDAINRLIGAQFPDDTQIYTYDSRNKLKSVSNNTSQISYLRDSLERVTSATVQGFGSLADYPASTINYSYDNNGNIVGKASNVANFSYQYNPANNLIGISNSFGDQFGFGYDGSSRLVQINRPGSVTNFEYDGANLITSIIHSKSGNTQDYFQYSYDFRNRITQKRSIAGSYNYAYNGNDQLVTASSPLSGPEQFSYDSMGNRITDQSSAYSYDQFQDKLLDDGVYTYLYDNNGNLTFKNAKVVGQSSYQYIYNSSNQLLETRALSAPFGSVQKLTNYAYDVAGRRLEKKVTDYTKNPVAIQTRKYSYDGDNILGEFDGAGQLLVSYTHSGMGPDDVLAMHVTANGVTTGIAANSASYFYLKDSLGSIIDVTDASGNIIQKYEYSAFGKIISIKDGVGNILSSPLVRNCYTFNGRELDFDTGLYFYRARYYDPNVGRFMQRDPNPGSLALPMSMMNSYAFVGNNPTNVRDPSGRSWLSSFWDRNSSWLTDVVVAVVVVAAIVLSGGTLTGALLAIASVAGGALAISAIQSAFQGGNYWQNLGDNFHTPFRVGSAFLLVGVGFADAWGDGVASAGGNGLNGYIASNQPISIFSFRGGMTLGSATVLDGVGPADTLESSTALFANHEFGHTVQMLGLTALAGAAQQNQSAAWATYLGIGGLGALDPSGSGAWWEGMASWLGTTANGSN